ncbi:acyl-CoA N-acyltransferase [Chlamydoabsidia padenii]|nr:acyl-CoA N-acyltransferase [Chlamydoabsidia padenii]
MTPPPAAPSSRRTRSISSSNQQQQTQPPIKKKTTVVPPPPPTPSISSKAATTNAAQQQHPQPSKSTSSNSRKRPLLKELAENTRQGNDSNKKSEPDLDIGTSNASTEPSSTPLKFDPSQVIHDQEHYMFKIYLGSKGNIAALCYLPTRFDTLVEFYHTEVPPNWRHLGIGDLLVQCAFEWVKQSNLLVIPSCPFVLRYIKTHYPDRNITFWKYIVDDINDKSRAGTLANRK